MKYPRIITILLLTILARPAFAADDHSLVRPEVQNYIGYGAIVLTLCLLIGVMLVLLRTFRVLTRILLKSEGYTEEQIAAEMAPACDWI